MSNGVATSNAAAESIQGSAARMRAEVLSVLRTVRIGEGVGLTCDEVERFTGMRHQTASARIYDLRKAGLVVDTGERRATKSGRAAIVWKAVA